VKTLNRPVNPSRNSNPFNHDTSYIKLYTSVKDGTSAKDEFGQLINPRYLDDVFNYKTSLSPLTRKVRIQIDRTEFLHMRDVQVFDYNNVNRALNKNAIQSSNYDSGMPASNSVDGNLGSYSHTKADNRKYHISDC
jgi:hypothetical protein